MMNSFEQIIENNGKKTKTKKQHIVPQFLQRYWSSNGKQVRIYQKNKNIIIAEVPISTNFQQKYFYGESGLAEYELSNIETKAAKIILEIIKNPKKYKRKNQTLPEEMTRFLSTLHSRSTNQIQLIQNWYRDFSDYVDSNLILTEQQRKVREEYQQKIIKSNELNGQVALINSDDERIKNEVYNGRYLLLKSKTTLFLSDESRIGFQPLSPHLLLVYGDMVDLDFKRRSTDWFFNFYNSMMIATAKNSVIIGEDTSLKYINKLR